MTLYFTDLLPIDRLVEMASRWRKRVSGSKNPLAKSIMAWAEVLRGKSGEIVLIGDMFILVATICNILEILEISKFKLVTGKKSAR